MSWRAIRFSGLSIAALAFLFSCGTSGGTAGSRPQASAGASNQSGGSTGIVISGGGGPGLIIDCDPSAPGSACNPQTPAPPRCGDGTLTDDQAWDDANTQDGDGCQANCLATQPGYSCSPAGKPCHELVIC